MIETDDVRASFYSINDFGIEATFTPSGGSPVVIAGIFDAPHIGVEAGGSVEVSVTAPTFMTRTVDVATADYGDLINISAVDYIIRDIMPDGTGMTTLVLEAG